MEWLDKNEYPFAHRYMDVQGHKLHYIDEGSGEVLLFVHGTPSWSFDFRNIIKVLRKKYRCIAIDHVGFGLSDKPGDYDYTTANHSRTLEIFIRQVGLKNFMMVVHDFGGPIGFNYAIEHPQTVKGFVILNSWMWSSKHEKEFIRFSKILKSPLLPLLYRYFNFSPRYILPNSFGDHKLSRNLLKQFTSPFANKRERNGTVAFAMSLLNDQDWFESLWLHKAQIEKKPTLLVWGMKDKFITKRYLDKFVAGFNNVTVEQITGAGHFPQEEEPALVGEAIDQFLIKNNGTISVHENAVTQHEFK